MPTTDHERAAAKLNLYLHVTGRRADGYHLLDSVAVFVDAGDELRVEAAKELTLEVEGNFAPVLAKENPDHNLVMKAARALREACGVTAGAKIFLSKNLPVGAGLGGGSADAAAALRLLARLWRLKGVPLERIARTLGSDVPACLRSRSLHMRGAGEEITEAPAEWPEFFVLVNPMKPVLTADVYRGFGGNFSQSVEKAWEQMGALGLLQELYRLRNDLEAPALALCPEIGEALYALTLQKDVKLARMSGSGATCFAVFANEAQAQAATEKLKQERPGWWIQTARRIERDPA